ncbi:Dynamin- GTPase protein [Massospora cicadina]|nr:Dynamin- GTPase protein [Massospora cicadina]
MASMLEDLIPLVNKLQDVFNTVGNDTLDLPQIVVIGGNGIVTRRPLVLQLITLRENKVDADLSERAQFLHNPSKIYTDFIEVRKEIEEETVREAGDNKGISRNPIHLKIYSPHVLNLTVVDLPGLMKIPIGDQPTDIEKQTKALLMDYISKQNSIILAVTPANVDLVNSESLKLAKSVDVEGKRTIGVLTKLDLMDAGTNALDILTGRDTVANKPIKDALQAETEFFLHHPAYKSIAHRCGTTHLAKTLNQRLPDMKSKLNTMIGQTQQELSSYGDPKVESNESKGLLVLRLLTDFVRAYTSSIDGTNPQAGKVLCGGARIYDIFNIVFGSALQAINPETNLSHRDIRVAIRNSTGPRPALFVPEVAFELLIKPQIKLLEQPSVRCVELAYEELMKICHSCSNKELTKYPKLNAKINEVVSNLLRERLTPTVSYVESLINIQLSYINTRHPDFIGASGALNAIETKANSQPNNPQVTTTASSRGAQSIVIPKGSASSSALDPNQDDELLENFFGGEDDGLQLERNGPNAGIEEREDTEVQLIRALISSYFKITSKSIQDLVPKAVMHLLVDHTKNHIQNRLVSSLYKPEQLDELLMEDETLTDERAKCQELLNIYKKAYEIINEAA